MIHFGNKVTDRNPVRGGLAHPAGIEPATYGLEIRCSVQLSYGCPIAYHSSIFCPRKRTPSTSRRWRVRRWKQKVKRRGGVQFNSSTGKIKVQHMPAHGGIFRYEMEMEAFG